MLHITRIVAKGQVSPLRIDPFAAGDAVGRLAEVSEHTMAGIIKCEDEKPTVVDMREQSGQGRVGVRHTAVNVYDLWFVSTGAFFFISSLFL